MVPSLKGAGREIGKQLGAADVQGQVGKAGRTSGLTWAKNAALGIGAAGLAAAGTVVGIALSKGFNRSIQLQEATKKLEGLGHSAETVAAISDNALGAVRGTAFGMGDAMTAAANAVAAGVKPGKDLQRTLTLVGDAATIAGADYGEMGAIFNKVSASNKVQMDSINQLHDRGVPALQFLAAELGVTAEEASKMASAGKIDFATFQAAMEAGLGGAAMKSGETFTGAAANVMAALGRLGDMFTGPIVDAGPALFQALAGAIDTLGIVLEPAAAKFSELLGPAVEKVAEYLGQLDFGALLSSLTETAGPVATLASAFSPLGIVFRSMQPTLPVIGDSLAGIAAALGGALSQLLPVIADSFMDLSLAVSGALASALPSLVPLIDSLAQLIPVLVPPLVALVPLVTSLLTGLIDLVTPLLENKDLMTGLAIAVMAGFAAFKAFMIVKTVVGAIKLLSSATSIAAAKQWLLNTALFANPIGLVIAAVAALVGAFIYLWNNNEAFRQFWIGLWDSIKSAAKAVADWFTGTLVPFFQGAWDAIKGAASAVADWFVGVWGSIKDAAAAVVGWFTGTVVPIFKAVWGGIRAAIEAAWTVIKVIFVALATAVSLLIVKPMQWLWKNIIQPVWKGITNDIGKAWAWVRDNVFQAIKAGVAAVGQFFTNLWKNAIVPAWNGIKSTISKVWDWIKSRIFQPILDFVKRVGQGYVNLWKNYIVPAWDGIKSIIGSVWSWIRDKVFAIITSKLADLGARFESFKTRATNAWGAVKTALNNTWTWIRDHIFAKFTSVVDALGRTFEKTKDVIKKAWDKIKAVAAGPVNFVIETVYMNGIKKTWDSIADAVGLDLKLPTVSPIKFANGTEDHRAQIAPAGAMRLWAEPETGGEAYIPLAASKRGRSTSILGAVANKFGYSLTPFANGGIFGSVGDWISGAVSNVSDLVSNIANFLSDPAQGIKDLILKPVESLFSQVMGGPLGQMLVELPKKAITGLIEKAKALIGLGGVEDGKGPLVGASPGNWLRPSKGRITSKFGARWGAFHNGVDFAGAPNWITSAVAGGRVSKVGWNVGYGNTGIGVMVNHGGGFESYYGHNPVGGVKVKVGQIVRGGQRIGTEGATGNVTGVHLHSSIFKNGRAIDPLSVYDNGGWLPHGAMGLNLSGRPEAVLTPEESAGLKAGLAGGSPLVGQLVVRDERTAITELEGLRRREFTRARLRAVTV